MNHIIFFWIEKKLRKSCLTTICLLILSTHSLSYADVESSCKDQSVVYISQFGGLAPAKRTLQNTLPFSKLNECIEKNDSLEQVFFLDATIKTDKPIIIKDKKNITFEGLGLRSKLSLENSFQGSPKLVPKSPCYTGPCDWRFKEEWFPVYIAKFYSGLFIVEDSSSITFKKLQFYDSWPNSILIKNSQTITVEHNNFYDGTNAIAAYGETTSDLQINNNKWIQNKYIWAEYDWAHVHHGLYNYYNGAFFQGLNILGNVMLEDNTISNAFNGIRIKVTSCDSAQPCPLNDNIIVRGNTFVKISDNAIEPEEWATNWLVEDNMFYGFHAPISLAGTDGENILIVNNKFYCTEKPRQKIHKSHLSSSGRHDGGKVLKLDKKPNENLKGFVFTDNHVFLRYMYADRILKMKFQKGVFPPDSIVENNIITSDF